MFWVSTLPCCKKNFPLWDNKELKWSLMCSLHRESTKIQRWFINLHFVTECFMNVRETTLDNQTELFRRCFCVLCREIWVVLPPWRPDWFKPWGLLCCGLSLFKASLCAQLAGMPITSPSCWTPAEPLQPGIPSATTWLLSGFAGGKVQRCLTLCFWCDYRGEHDATFLRGSL